MQDRSWMLNAEAIRTAKQCIAVVKQEHGVKLLLSDPNFLQLLHQYVDTTGSRALNDAYSRLLGFAGPGTTLSQLRAQNQHTEEMKAAAGADLQQSAGGSEMVAYSGKQYPRWRNGREFAGLYRGQPRYL